MEARLPRAGNHVEEKLGVRGALEDGAFGDQLFLQHLGVGDVAIVGKGDLPLAAGDDDRLGVLQLVGAVGGVAHVADAQPRGMFLRKVVREGRGDDADAAVRRDPAAALVGQPALPCRGAAGRTAVEELLRDIPPPPVRRSRQSRNYVGETRCLPRRE